MLGYVAKRVVYALKVELSFKIAGSWTSELGEDFLKDVEVLSLSACLEVSRRYDKAAIVTMAGRVMAMAS